MKRYAGFFLTHIENFIKLIIFGVHFMEICYKVHS